MLDEVKRESVLQDEGGSADQELHGALAQFQRPQMPCVASWCPACKHISCLRKANFIGACHAGSGAGLPGMPFLRQTKLAGACQARVSGDWEDLV